MVGALDRLRINNQRDRVEASPQASAETAAELVTDEGDNAAAVPSGVRPVNLPSGGKSDGRVRSPRRDCQYRKAAIGPDWRQAQDRRTASASAMTTPSPSHEDGSLMSG